MGNDHSRSKGEGEADNAGPLDYYELLQVTEESTYDEIKRSYRKLALVHHPDKNPDRVEEATKMFADLQQAFEILSDPNERAFYDKHRFDHIETTDDDFYEHVRAGDASFGDPKSKFNRRKAGDPGVKLDHIMRFFDPKLARKMDDTNEGFYSVYRTLFNLLASDELLHTPEGQTPVHYPPFGDSTTPYAPPPGLTKAERAKSTWVRDFYTAWAEYTTEKRFEWLEKWDTTRGEDRNIRRLMEKENKKLREDHRKEYMDAVRALAQFVQHRDPRYKAYMLQQAQAKKARKAEGRSGTSTPGSSRGPRVDREAARRRDEERMKAAEAFQEQEWQKLRKDPEEEAEDMEEYQDQGDGTGIRMDDGAGGEVFECVACNKVFQSEASWSNHERSKKHKQAVWRLAKEMRAEAGEMGEDLDDFATPQETASEDSDIDFDEDDLVKDLEELEIQEAEEQSLAEAVKLDEEDEAPKKSKKKTRGTASPMPEPIPEPAAPLKEDSAAEDASDAESKAPELSKREKRRAREAKKKAEEEAAKAAMKEARKEAKRAAKAPPPPPTKPKVDDKFITPKTKGKKGKQAKVEKVVVTDADVERAASDIQALRTKMVDKWDTDWTDLITRLLGVYGATDKVADLAVLCLGLGKPYGDRTAKIQLAFILELTAALGASVSVIKAYDPVFDEGDCRVLQSLGCEVIEENLRGEHKLDDSPHLVYMPHCSKALYESFLSANYAPRLGAAPQCVLLGNDLGEYIPGFIRPGTEKEKEEPAEEFVKPKKKRKGRGTFEPQVQDSVLRRLVPHFDVFMLSELPETNLPGFARAFLSTGFHWLTPSGADKVDWETPLPPVEWPEDGEVL